MAELDARRIEELAKEPPKVLRSEVTDGARDAARLMLETQALMRREDPGAGSREGGGG